MIIWSGHGILIPVFAVMGLIFGSVVGAFVSGEDAGPGVALILGGLFATGLVWLYALTLGKTQESVLLDPATGRQVLYRKSHTFFFIPAFAWAVISSVLAVLFIGMGITSMVAGPPEPKSTSPGAAELSAAERFISGKSNGIIHGNTPEAKEMAETFSELASMMRGELIEKGGSSKVSLSGGEFLTYCQTSDHGVAFLVHVPSLRKFSDDAKKVMCDAAWVAANQAVAEMNPAPANLAVGVRGVILYESILLGSPAELDPSNPTAGLKSRHQSLESDVLLPFFAPSTGESSGKHKSDSAASTNPASSDLPATSNPASKGSAAQEKPSETPAVGETKPGVPAATPAPVPPKDTPALPQTSTPESPAPATSASVSLPTEVKEWKSLDGRVLKASLVRFPDAEGASAEFKREDGQVFTIPLDRFAPESAAELKRIHEGLSTR